MGGKKRGSSVKQKISSAIGPNVSMGERRSSSFQDVSGKID